MSRIGVDALTLTEKTADFQPKIADFFTTHRAAVQAASDYLCILLVPMASFAFISFSDGGVLRTILFWNLVAASSLLLMTVHGGYRRGLLSRPGQNARPVIRYFLITCGTLLAAALLLGHPHAVTRFWTTLDLVLTPILFLFTRYRLHALPPDELSAGPLLICQDRVPRNLAAALAQQCLPGRVSGVLYLSRPSKAADWPTIPDATSLLALVRSRPKQHVIFIHRTEPNAEETELLSALLAYPVNLWLAFDLGSQLPNRLAGRAGACKLVPLGTDTLVNSLNPVKRAFDIAISLALLCVFSLAFPIIALLVRFSGPGPVVFRQARTGAHGQSFTVLKFRTMRHEAEGVLRQAVPDDARVTKVGRFLRRSSLDELLQLINVLKGDMSLVGPRPHAPDTPIEGTSFEDFIKRHTLRYRVKPGMTGLAQIRGQRGETKQRDMLEQRIESDLEYIETWSVWLDILILLRTVPVVLRQNAY